MSELKWRGREVMAKVQAALPKALYAAGLVVEGQAKINCTNKGIVDTGNLVDSITTQASGGETSTPGPRSEVDAIGGADKDSARVGTQVEYAVYQEFGTKHMAARPYLRPALDEHQPEIRKAFAAQIRRALE